MDFISLDFCGIPTLLFFVPVVWLLITRERIKGVKQMREMLEDVKVLKSEISSPSERE